MSILRSVVIGMIILLCGPSLNAAAEGKKMLRTAIFDGCPFICLDGSGTFLDILRLALQDTEYQMQLIHMPFERAKRSIVVGDIDLLPGMLKDGIDGPLYPDDWLFFTQMCFFVQNDDPWSYNGLNSLRNRRLAVERGIIHTPEFFQYLQRQPGIHTLSGANILGRQLKMLRLGRVDTITAERTVLRHHRVSLSGEANAAPRMAGCFEREFEYVAVSSRRSDARSLTDLLSARLRAVKQSAAFLELIN